MSSYDNLWIVKDGSKFVSKEISNHIYKMLVVKEKFMYDCTHNGEDALDIILFRLKQEFGKIGYRLVDNVNTSVLETSISLNLFQQSICV